jgi:hypothetical protein
MAQLSIVIASEGNLSFGPALSRQTEATETELPIERPSCTVLLAFVISIGMG